MKTPIDYANEPKQIPTRQTRPSLLWMKRAAEKYEKTDACSVRDIQAWDVSDFGFEVRCLLAYVKELEEKLVEMGVPRNEDSNDALLLGY